MIEYDENPPRAFDPLPAGHAFAGLTCRGFKLAYVDPPWQWNSRSDTRQDRATSRHYQTMPTREIAALPVHHLCSVNSVLLLWAINSMLPDAFEVMHAWGFTYKTIGFAWGKLRGNGAWHAGLGFWTRQNVELCLLGTRGDIARRAGATNVRQLITAPMREHSRKPDIRGEIERLCIGPYIELFSREQRAGWTTWGNEKSKFGFQPAESGTPVEHHGESSTDRVNVASVR